MAGKITDKDEKLCSCSSRNIGKIEETVGDLKRSIIFSPGHVCEGMNKEFPYLSPGWSHGIGSVRIFFVVQGEKGAITFTILTDMYPKEASVNKEGSHHSHSWGVGLDYHALKPQYENETRLGSCNFLNGESCYCEGTVLGAETPFNIFVKEGLDALWKYLEGEYGTLK